MDVRRSQTGGVATPPGFAKLGGPTFHDKEADEIRTRMVDVDRCLPAESGLEKM